MEDFLPKMTQQLQFLIHALHALQETLLEIISVVLWRSPIDLVPLCFQVNNGIVISIRQHLAFEPSGITLVLRHGQIHSQQVKQCRNNEEELCDGRSSVVIVIISWQHAWHFRSNLGAFSYLSYLHFSNLPSSYVIQY